MIFKVLEIRKMASEAKENPGKFAGSQVGEMIFGMLVTPAFFTLLILASFFILGFTHFLGGPYWFFKLLFFLTLTAVLFVFYILRKIYLLIKSVTKNVVESTIKVESTVIE